MWHHAAKPKSFNLKCSSCPCMHVPDILIPANILNWPFKKDHILFSGKGEWTMEYARYARVNDEVRDQIVHEWRVANNLDEPERAAKKQKR